MTKLREKIEKLKLRDAGMGKVSFFIIDFLFYGTQILQYRSSVSSEAIATPKQLTHAWNSA